MNTQVIEAYNFRLLEAILIGLQKYLAFTLTTVDFDEVFRIGKRGEILRPKRGELLSRDVVRELSEWVGLPVEYLFGEKQIITGLRLAEPIDGNELPVLDARITQITEIPQLDDIWRDPLALDSFYGKEKYGDHQEVYHMGLLLEAVAFLLKRAGQLPNIPSLKARQNRHIKEAKTRLHMLADTFWVAIDPDYDGADSFTAVDALEKDLSVLRFDPSFGKLICMIAKTGQLL